MKWSNTGFKIKYSLIAGTARRCVFPYHTQYVDAASVRTDVGSGTVFVAWWSHVTHSMKTYAGILNNTPIVPGEAYNILASPARDWVVCGYELPTDIIQLYGPLPDKTFVSLPPNTKLNTASELFNFTLGASAILDEGYPIGAATKTWTASGGTDFSIVPGNSYTLYVDADTTIKPEVY